MIDDIIYDSTEFILEIPLGTPGGVITSYSLDGNSFDIKNPESVSIFIS